jgi:hypothetical protein
LQALKGKVRESIEHESGHLALMRLVDVTDDTVTIQKSVLEEIISVRPTITYTATGFVVPESKIPPLLSVARSRWGKKLLLRLLQGSGSDTGKGMASLEPDERALFPTAAPATSKKPAHTRRKEHLTYLRKPLLALCTKYAPEMLRSDHGSVVLEAVMAVYNDESVAQAVCDAFAGVEKEQEEEVEEEEEVKKDSDSGSDSGSSDEEDEEKEEKEEGSADADGESDEEDDDDEDKKMEKKEEAAEVEVPPLEENPSSYATLKRLLKRETVFVPDESKQELWADPSASGPTALASKLLALLLDGDGARARAWAASNRGCLLLVALAQAAPNSFAPAVKAINGDAATIKNLKSSAAAGSGGPGAGALLEQIGAGGGGTTKTKTTTAGAAKPAAKKATAAAAAGGAKNKPEKQQEQSGSSKKRRVTRSSSQ